MSTRLKAVGVVVAHHPSVAIIPCVVLACMVTGGIVAIHQAARVEKTNAADKMPFEAAFAMQQLADRLYVSQIPGVLSAEFMAARRSPQNLTTLAFWLDSWFPLAPPGVIERVNVVQGDYHRVALFYPEDHTQLYNEALDAINQLIDEGQQGSKALVLRDVAISAAVKAPIMSAELILIASSYFLRSTMPVYALASNSSDGWGWRYWNGLNSSDQTGPQGMCSQLNTWAVPPGMSIPCYDPTTKLRWWGYVSVWFKHDILLQQLEKDMTDKGYEWRLTRQLAPGVLPKQEPPDLVGETDGWASCGGHKTEPVQQLVTNTTYWALALCKPKAHVVSWEKGLYALVVIFSFLMASLVFVMLLSRSQQQMLLDALVPKPARREMEQLLGSEGKLTVQLPDTPATTLIDMLTGLLEDRQPAVSSIITLLRALRQHADLYRPLDLSFRMQKAAGMDSEAAAALMAVLDPGAAAVARSGDPSSNGGRSSGNGGVNMDVRMSGAFAITSTHGNAQEDPGYRSLGHALSSLLGIKAPATLNEGGITGLPRVDEGDEGTPPRRGSVIRPSVTSATGSNAPEGSLADAVRSRLGAEGAGGVTGGGWDRSSTGLVLPPPGVPPRIQGGGGGREGVEPFLLNTQEGGGGGVNLMNTGGSVLAGNGSNVLGSHLKTRTDMDFAEVTGELSGGSLDGPAEAVAQLPTGLAGFMMNHRPPPPVITELEQVLERKGTAWSFDAWELNSASQGHPLSTMAYYAFHCQGLIGTFGINGRTLASFLRTLESGYKVTNPYHNSVHAADVVQSVHLLLTRGGLSPGYATPFHAMCCLLAAVVHDYEHKGVTNDHLVNTKDELALTYNDRSPHENHHVAAAFKVLRTPGTDFLSHFEKSDWDRMRKLVIDLVLATDMKQHFAINGQFTSVHRLATSDNVKAVAAAAAAAGKSAAAAVTLAAAAQAAAAGQTAANNIVIGTTTNNALYMSTGTTTAHSQADPGSGSGAYVGSHSRLSAGQSLRHQATGELHLAVMPVDEAEQLLTLQMMLKCADLGHVATPLPVHLKWVAGLEEEMYRQGDRERELDLTISPLCDRTKTGVTKSQTGFFEVVVLPLFSNFCSRFPAARALLDGAVANLRYWHKEAHLAAQKRGEEV